MKRNRFKKREFLREVRTTSRKESFKKRIEEGKWPENRNRLRNLKRVRLFPAHTDALWLLLPTAAPFSQEQ